MLREENEDLPNCIYILFRTDGSLFNLRRHLAHTKTIEELISELLFADDWALLAHTKEALQHIVNRFSLKKTEVLYQPPLREAYSPFHVSIDGTNINAVERFTYLGSVISNDATVTKNLDNRLSKACNSFGRLSNRVLAESLAPPLHEDPGIQGRRPSHPPAWFRDLGSLSEADQATGAVSPTLLALRPWHPWQDHVSNEEVLKRASLPSIESILLQVQLR